MQTAICVFHQRFSTNTLPKWPLAQPFRFLPTTAEINTITGNRNWAQARRTKFTNELIPDLALERLPQIEQVFIGGAGLSDQDFAIKLFSARRRSSVANAADSDHYICSFSHKTIIYKGLMMPADLAAFYPDLGDERLQTAICVFHQRFSTNTLPKWPLAQPFRFL
ncbi:hypothetical protein ED857_19580, partial [Acinetobacter baumannii]